MCTVTVVAYEQGVRLLCNRDERRTRPAALPPRIHDTGGLPAVFPIDPQGGGTWIGMNAAGVVVALLNLCRTVPAITTRQKHSRGQVVPQLLKCTSLADVATAVDTLDPYAFAPFQVVIVHDRRVVVATSNAVPIRCIEHNLDMPLLFTSSSLGDARVWPPRRRLFERMVVRNRAGWLHGQAQFHDHQWSDRPELSIRMARRDALTVSRTTVDVTSGERQLLYEAPLGADL
jgi:hypothetical protein